MNTGARVSLRSGLFGVCAQERDGRWTLNLWNEKEALLWVLSDLHNSNPGAKEVDDCINMYNNINPGGQHRENGTVRLLN